MTAPMMLLPGTLLSSTFTMGIQSLLVTLDFDTSLFTQCSPDALFCVSEFGNVIQLVYMYNSAFLDTSVSGSETTSVLQNFILLNNVSYCWQIF